MYVQSQVHSSELPRGLRVGSGMESLCSSHPSLRCASNHSRTPAGCVPIPTRYTVRSAHAETPSAVSYFLRWSSVCPWVQFRSTQRVPRHGRSGGGLSVRHAAVFGVHGCGGAPDRRPLRAQRGRAGGGRGATVHGQHPTGTAVLLCNASARYVFIHILCYILQIHTCTTFSCSFVLFHAFSYLLFMLFHAISCPFMPFHAHSCPFIPFHARSCPFMPFHAISCHFMPFHAISCPFMPFHALSCHFMPFHARSYPFMPFHAFSCPFMPFHALPRCTPTTCAPSTTPSSAPTTSPTR